MLQTAGYQAILHGHAGGYRSHILAGGRWTFWHGTARQGAFPPQPHIDWPQEPSQAYYMTADPWPLAVLLHTVSAPNKWQEPGWVSPPALVWSPDQEEHLRDEGQGDAIRATDLLDLHAGPITHARPAATLAVAQRGQQNPHWVVCIVQPGGRANCRLRPRAPARARSRSPLGRLHSHDRQGATGGRTPRPPALLPTEGQGQGSKAGSVAGSGAPCRPRAPAGGPDHSVPLATSLPRPAMEGQARPPNRRHALASVAAGRRAARRRPESRTRACNTSPRCGGPGPRVSATHGSAGQPALRTSAGGRHPKVGAAPPGARGHRTNEMPPVCRQLLHKRGDVGKPGVARGARCSPGGRQGSGLPNPPREGTEVPVACPVRPRRPTTQKARGRHPERPREAAVRGNKDPSPLDWPPWPPCGPRLERTPRTPWPQRTQETWLPQRTQRQCQCGTAVSRRTRRTTPYGSSHGNCATASSCQTGPFGTRSGGAGGWRPVPTGAHHHRHATQGGGLCHHAP